MKSKLFLSAVALSFVLLPVISQAESTASSTKSATSTEARIRAREEFELRKKELEVKKEEFKAEMELKRKELEVRKENFKAEVEEKRETVRNEIQERKEGALSQIKGRINKFSENVVKRFNAAVNRLEQLAVRIDSRIAKMEAEGKNVKDSKELLAVARIKIETAKTSIAAIELDYQALVSNNATSTNTIKSDFEDLRQTFDKAKSDLKAAHSALVDVIENLKPGTRKNTGTATSTATTTPN